MAIAARAIIAGFTVAAVSPAAADVYSFVLVPILPPAEVDEVVNVYGPNRHGDFVMWAEVDGIPISYLWQDEVWSPILVDGMPYVRVAGITDDRLIFGTRGTGPDDNFGFYWDPAIHAGPQPLGFRPVAASRQGDIVGNRSDIGGMGILPGLGAIELVPFPGGTTTFATSVNAREDNFSGPGGNVLPYIVGRAFDANGIGHAALWIDGLEIFSLETGDYIPTAVSDGMDVSGCYVRGPDIRPCVWVHQTGSQPPEWVRYDLPGGEAVSAADINAVSELVGGTSLWVVDTEIIHISLDEVTYIPKFVPLDDGDFTEIDIESFAVRGIADHGEMLGVAWLADGRSIPMKIVPYDRNNNDIPDFREVDLISAARNPEAGFIPPDMTQPRIGLHAPTRWLARSSSQYDPANSIEDVHVVRFLTSHDATHAILHDPYACGEFADLISNWTKYERPERQTGAEIVYTEQTRFRPEWHPLNEDDMDYIPPRDTPVRSPDELTQRMVLQNSKTFGKLYARYVDYVQLGNETFTSNGVYYFEDFEYEVNGEKQYFTGTMLELPAEALVAADAALRRWWQQRVDALLIGSALARRPFQIIGSAIPTQAIYNALDGDSYDFNHMQPGGGRRAGANRSAFAVRVAIEFCNEMGAITDLHMHFYNYQDHLVQIVEALVNAPGLSRWPRPEQVVCLEYGPMASHQWWYTDGWGEETRKFFDNDPLTLPDGVETWDEWIDFWMANDPELIIHPTFLEDGMDVLMAYDYWLICYSDTLMTTRGEDESAPHDMSAIFPSKLDPEFEPIRQTRWKRAYEDAARARRLSNFAPRPIAPPHYCELLNPEP